MRRIIKVIPWQISILLFFACACSAQQHHDFLKMDNKNNAKSHSKEIISTDKKQEIMSLEFWSQRIQEKDKIILSTDQIQLFNQKIIQKVDSLYNLDDYDMVLNREKLIILLEKEKIPEKVMYDSNGKIVKQDFYRSILANMAIEKVREKNPVIWGITLRKASIRSFPTTEAVFDSADRREIDRFQETGCQACEGVLVLHQSKDRQWCFVQSYNYRGWMKREDIAFTRNKMEAQQYLHSKRFLMVTGNVIHTQYNPYRSQVSDMEFSMGTKIPLLSGDTPDNIDGQSVTGNYIVMLPAVDENGWFHIEYGLVAKSQDVTEGYLPYTRNNIIKQAFKLLGDRYDWGDKYTGRDCSSYIMYIYKTFGFFLPRNSYEQESMKGAALEFGPRDTLIQRNETLSEMKPGAIIFMSHHVMMYLGKVNEAHYMIHDFTAYGKKEAGKIIRVPVYEVAVTPTNMLMTSGIPFEMKFTSIMQVE